MLSNSGFRGKKDYPKLLMAILRLACTCGRDPVFEGEAPLPENREQDSSFQGLFNHLERDIVPEILPPPPESLLLFGYSHFLLCRFPSPKTLESPHAPVRPLF
ncbi:hypothetical protein VNO77_15525 [Canavalia gladiata]|uniref:Uncharacterized protein n=1 Tax=Canavalia gladiata TaxID=3824 RepID=A0AAN9QP90_CANGL